MSGKVSLKFQWGKAKKKPFVSYPYWSIELESSNCFKNKGYNVARATLSRQCWRKLIINYITYELLIDKIMNRNKEFSFWLKDTIEALQSIQMQLFNKELSEKIKTDMLANQKFGSDYFIEFFSEVINDEKNE